MPSPSSFPTLSDSTLNLEPSISLDSSQRIYYNNSYWHSIFHYKEKQSLNDQLWQSVSSFFQERYKIDDRQHFLRIWKEIGQKEWTIKSPLTVGRLHAIDEAFKNKLIYYGPGINLLPPDNTSKYSPARHVVKILLHGDLPTVDLIQRPLLRAVLIKNDAAWLNEFRSELQQELNQLIKNPPKNAAEEIVWRQFLGYIIALLPFSYPSEGELFNIPHLDSNRICHQTTYKTNVIELTPKHLSTPISAIGMVPIDNADASPILSYLGTTFPAGNGFAATIQADFPPKNPVGAEAYRQGKENISLWFKDKKNVHLVGTSLGGALAFHTLLDFHSHLAQADIYNPPGLYEHCWKNRSFDEGCPINIYRQPSDIVPKMGFWPTGSKVKLFDIIPHQTGVLEKLPLSHMQAYSGCRKVTFIKSDPKEENKNFSRRALAFLHRYLGPYVFYYPTRFILCCYRMISATQKYWKT